MIINQAAVDLVKQWEGLRLEAYRCSAGHWTIGYGTTANAGIGIKPVPGMRITLEQAEEYLWRALEKFAEQIRPAITAPINENQFGAFLSLAYNIGPTAFRSSSALRHFNAGNLERAAASIKLFNKERVNGQLRVSQGLVNRRAAEVALFTKPVPTVLTRPAAVLERVKEVVAGGNGAGAVTEKVEKKLVRRWNDLHDKVKGGIAAFGLTLAGAAVITLHDENIIVGLQQIVATSLGEPWGLLVSPLVGPAIGGIATLLGAYLRAERKA